MAKSLQPLIILFALLGVHALGRGPAEKSHRPSPDGFRAVDWIILGSGEYLSHKWCANWIADHSKSQFSCPPKSRQRKEHPIEYHMSDVQDNRLPGGCTSGWDLHVTKAVSSNNQNERYMMTPLCKDWITGRLTNHERANIQRENNGVETVLRGETVETKDRPQKCRGWKVDDTGSLTSAKNAIYRPRCLDWHVIEGGKYGQTHKVRLQEVGTVNGRECQDWRVNTEEVNGETIALPYCNEAGSLSPFWFNDSGKSHMALQAATCTPYCGGRRSTD